MREVVGRRYKRLLEEGKDLPDLVLVDGGKGQLGAAAFALDELGLGDQPLASLAKREELIFVRGRDQPIALPRSSPVLQLVQRVRDEAHRFAVGYHRKARSARTLRSELDDIKGVGPTKRKALLSRFGSVRGVRGASEAELSAAVGKATAARLAQPLRPSFRARAGRRPACLARGTIRGSRRPVVSPYVVLTMARPRILSGMRPTGPLHLGHLTGALDNWVPLQDTYDCFYCIVDWHALTTDYADPSRIRENIVEVAADWLAAGLDPARSALFVQSEIKEHAELHLLLSMVIPVPWLERVPTYKEQQQNLKDRDLSTYGFLGYPLLQTADIVVYKADAVPVGEDQAPHVELSREVVRRFNNFYGPVFPEPKTLLTPTPRMPGTDGRKMSKSYDNAIFLKDPPEVVRQKLKPMVTDPKRVRRTDPGTPEECPVFDLHKAFSPPSTQEWAAAGCRTAGIGCLDCKAKLADHLLERLAPVHARRSELVTRTDTVWDVLHAGARQAREVAAATMDGVRAAMKIKY